MATRTHSWGWLGGLAAVAATIAIFVLVSGGDPAASPRGPDPAAAAGRPVRPPGPNGPKRAGLVEPTMPVMTPALRAEVADQVRGHARPGEAAFRLVSDRYVDENLELANRQAAAEGLTLAEVRELTYFGLMAMATQRLDDVQEVTGRALTETDRGALAELMQASNGTFRDAMRALVARKASEADRWNLIRATEAEYQAQLFRITGLDAALLDDLLAGNLALPGAPSRGEPPTGEPVRDGFDHSVATPPRPSTP